MFVLREIPLEAEVVFYMGKSEVMVCGWIMCDVTPAEPATTTDPGFGMQVKVKKFDLDCLSFGSGDAWNFDGGKNRRDDWRKIAERIVEGEISTGKFDAYIERIVKKTLLAFRND